MTRIGADPSFRQLVGAALSLSPRTRWAFGSRTATGRPSAPSPESVSESAPGAPSWSIVKARPCAKETVSPPPFEEVVWKSASPLGSRRPSPPRTWPRRRAPRSGCRRTGVVGARAVTDRIGVVVDGDVVDLAGPGRRPGGSPAVPGSVRSIAPPPFPRRTVAVRCPALRGRWPPSAAAPEPRCRTGSARRRAGIRFGSAGPPFSSSWWPQSSLTWVTESPEEPKANDRRARRRRSACAGSCRSGSAARRGGR